MSDLQLLHSLGTAEHFRKDEIVFMEGDDGENMYIVLKGMFGVYVNSFVDFPVRVAGIGQGSFFGEMSLVDGWPRSATIITEENGTALAIEKDKFALMIEKRQDIANGILETLKARADSTAEAVRDRGKYAPPAPPVPCAEQCGDVQRTIAVMTSLAQHIRQLNNLLYEPSYASGCIGMADAGQKGTVNLLPEGYKLFNIKDTSDNSKMLQMKTVVCPYCFGKLEAYIPRISHLVQPRPEPDGRIIYKGFNILLYTNIVCPNCNYADTYREFCKFRHAADRPIYLGNQFKNEEKFTGFADTHNHTVDEAILSYYLSIKCLRRITNDPLRFAKAWIRLYWIYSDIKEFSYAKQAARRAIDLYGDYLCKHSELTSHYDQMRINIMLGELSAAIKDYRQAQGFFEANVLIGRKSNVARELAEESLKRYRAIKDLLS